MFLSCYTPCGWVLLCCRCHVTLLTLTLVLARLQQSSIGDWAQSQHQNSRGVFEWTYPLSFHILHILLSAENVWVSRNCFVHLRVQFWSPLLVGIHTPFGSTSRTYHCMFRKSQFEQRVLLRPRECATYHAWWHPLVVNQLTLGLKLA